MVLVSGIDLDAIRAKLAEHDSATLKGDAWVARMARLGESVPDLLAEVERLTAANAALVAAKGDGWRDGYEAGCDMSHSLGCDSVKAERDSLGRQLEEARREIGRLRAERER